MKHFNCKYPIVSKFFISITHSLQTRKLHRSCYKKSNDEMPIFSWAKNPQSLLYQRFFEKPIINNPDFCKAKSGFYDKLLFRIVRSFHGRSIRILWLDTYPSIYLRMQIQLPDFTSLWLSEILLYIWYCFPDSKILWLSGLRRPKWGISGFLRQYAIPDSVVWIISQIRILGLVSARAHLNGTYLKGRTDYSTLGPTPIDLGRRGTPGWLVLDRIRIMELMENRTPVPLAWKFKHEFIVSSLFFRCFFIKTQFFIKLLLF